MRMSKETANKIVNFAVDHPVATKIGGRIIGGCLLYGFLSFFEKMVRLDQTAGCIRIIENASKKEEESKKNSENEAENA